MHEALEGKRQRVGTRCAHRAGGDAVLEEGLGQLEIRRHIHREHVRRQICAGHRTCAIAGHAEEMILEGDHVAAGIETCLEGMETAGTEVVMHHVVFTGPLQFYRTAFHAFRNRRGFKHEVIGKLATEATADTGHVQR